MSKERDEVLQQLDKLVREMWIALLSGAGMAGIDAFRHYSEKILAIPEIAKGLELLEKTAVESQIKSEVQPTPPMDVVTEARLLRADIEQRTIKEVK